MLAFWSWARYYPRRTIRSNMLFVKEKVEESGVGGGGQVKTRSLRKAIRSAKNVLNTEGCGTRRLGNRGAKGAGGKSVVQK
jgi:hypothetical protein